MTSTGNVNSSNATRAAYGTSGISNGNIIAMSPESLVALCALQLQQFDENIMSRMNEKDKNMGLQERLAALSSKLESLTNGIGAKSYNEKADVVRELDGLISELSADPTKADLCKKLQGFRDKLQGQKQDVGGAAAQQGFQQAFDNAYKVRTEKFAKAGLTEENFWPNYGKFINEDGSLKVPGSGDATLDAAWASLSQDEKDAVTARADESKAWLALGPVTVGNGSLSASEVGELSSLVESSGKSLSSRNDAIMMELQSLVSQRSTTIQMTSNLTNTLLESAKAIAANIGR